MSGTPFRQIRAFYDDKNVTVYQAYSAAIAGAAVGEQRLDASPSWSLTRMTWIKPSWCWMMYRSGYSYKDKGQERILALKMTHEGFRKLLRHAVVPQHNLQASRDRSSGAADSEDKATRVVVQWDPERDPWLAKLDYRSIQIGVPAGLREWWVNEGIVHIEDVTDRARTLYKEINEGTNELTIERLVEMGLMPVEREFEVDEDLRSILRMDER